MTHARLKEGPRAPLFYWALGLLCCGPVFGQTVPVSELAQCVALESQAEKLACFEAIVAEAQGLPDSGTTATGATAGTASVSSDEAAAVVAATAFGAGESLDAAVPAAPSGAQAEAVRSVAAAAPVQELPSVTESAPVESTAALAASASATAVPAVTSSETGAPVAVESAPVATTETESPSTRAEDAFGRDHLEEEESDVRRVLYATVTEVSKSSRGALVFSLDNGQVWRQTEPRFYPYPRGRAFDIEIEEGLLGKYSLQVEGEGRKVTVRRTK